MEKPRLENFGLTEGDYNLYKSKDYFYGGAKVGCGFIVLSWFVLILIGIIRNKGVNNDAVTIILSIPVLLFPAIIAGIIFGFINEQIAKIKDKNYRQFLKYEKQKKEYDAWWTRNQSIYWQGLSGRRFEEEVGYLYHQLGYKVRLTPYSDDGGIDLVLEKDSIKTIVQCKAHNKRLGPAIVRELYGTLINSGAEEAILATLQGVTTGAQAFISDKPISVITINDILRMRKQLEKRTNSETDEM